MLRAETEHVKDAGHTFSYLKTDVLAPHALLDGWSGSDRDRLEEIFDLYANEYDNDGRLQKNEWEAFVDHLSRLDSTSESDARIQGANAAEQARLQENRAMADAMSSEFFEILEDTHARTKYWVDWGELADDLEDAWDGTYRGKLEGIYDQFAGSHQRADPTEFRAFIDHLRAFKAEYGS